MTMLVVDHLAKTYGSGVGGVEAIREVSFDVREREFVCIVGPSGGGKTTLLRCLCGLHDKTAGSIQLHGREILEPPAEMAAVFQDYSRSLMPWFTVRKNVALPLRNTIEDPGERTKRVGWSLGEVGLDGFGDRDIDLPRPRDQLTTKSLPRFAEYRSHVLELIRATSRPDELTDGEQAVAARMHG
jgi:NitT/TauT family transport system ATP-binding protein